MTVAASSVASADALVVLLIVLTRLLLPLAMPRWPLPVIIGCLLVDGVDQTLLQRLTDLPLDNYQSYDKALDIYYLSIAYLTTLRNWTSHSAYRIAAFLLYYRLVGVAIFEGMPEASDPDDPRWILLIFPNTFEYFFIAYEAIRLRWDPRRLSTRFLVLLAAGIWVFVKLPQEWWIHIAQIDTTDLIRDKPWVGVLMALGVLALLAVARWVVWPRTPPADHRLRIESDPLPAGISAETDRLGYISARGVFTRVLAEKIALLALLTFIFGSIFPGVELSLTQAAVWVAALVLLDTAITVGRARRGRSIRGMGLSFLALAAVNAGFVLVFLNVLDREVATDTASSLVRTGAPLFFVLLLSLVVVLFDRFRPVHDYRFHPETAPSSNHTSGLVSRSPGSEPASG